MKTVGTKYSEWNGMVGSITVAAESAINDRSPGLKVSNNMTASKTNIGPIMPNAA